MPDEVGAPSASRFDAANRTVLSDAEIEAMALADSSEGTIADDAVPIGEFLARRHSWRMMDDRLMDDRLMDDRLMDDRLMDDRQEGLLPEWYMPTPWPRARARTVWARATVFGLVGVFLMLEALGLCSTYGHVVIP